MWWSKPARRDKPEPSLWVGLSIDTDLLTAVVLRQGTAGTRQFVTAAACAAKGFRGAMVTSIAQASDSVAGLLAAIGNKVSLEHAEYVIALPAVGLQATTSKGSVATQNGEVSSADLTRASTVARAGALPAEHTAVLSEITSIQVDGTEVDDPTGLSGRRLEVEALVLGCPDVVAKNLTMLLARCGIDAARSRYAVACTATARRQFAWDEMEWGAVYIEIGNSCSTAVWIRRGQIRKVVSEPYGDEQITHVLASRLRAPLAASQALKYEAATSTPGVFEVPSLAERLPRIDDEGIARRLVVDELEAILVKLRERIAEPDVRDAQIVLGGAASGYGVIRPIAKTLFGTNMPVRVASGDLVARLLENNRATLELAIASSPMQPNGD